MKTSIFVAMFLSLFVPFLLWMLSGKHWIAVQNKARARRLAENHMAARLLRFNI